MRNARIHEGSAFLHEAMAGVEGACVQLRIQHDLCVATAACGIHQRIQQQRADALAAPGLAHGHAADVAVGQQTAGAHGLTVERMLSGPWGGDLQIGARLAVGELDGVIFLRDPMTPQPHEPDINALVRACDVHNIPCATNLATADLVMSALQRVAPDPKEIHA